MTRKCLFVLVILLLAFGVAACKKAAPEQDQTDPTLPDFDVEQSPAQQLAAAVDKTRQQNTYDIRYGVVTTCDGKSEEHSQTQAVSPEKPLDEAVMLAYLPQLPDRQEFLEDFCNRPLRIIPSNTGLLRYQLTELAWDDAAALLYSREPEHDFDGANCEIALEVDAQGRLSRLEIIVEMEAEKRTYFVDMTFRDSP